MKYLKAENRTGSKIQLTDYCIDGIIVSHICVIAGTLRIVGVSYHSSQD